MYAIRSYYGSGDPEGLDQIIKQVSKLIDVLHCVDHTFDESVVKEMGLIKIAVDSEGRSDALQRNNFV